MKKIVVSFRFVVIVFFALVVSSYCIAQNPKKSGFAKGADVGWLPQMEATGYKFYDKDGTEKDCLQLLKDRGINSIRLRVWVNPNDDKASGHCSKEETIVMALRAQKYGNASND
jgi:arabinogalactan endo-1,4-beta-galactosidase